MQNFVNFIDFECHFSAFCVDFHTKTDCMHKIRNNKFFEFQRKMSVMSRPTGIPLNTPLVRHLCSLVGRLFCERKIDDQRRVVLVLWDTAGQEDYDRLRPLCYQRTDVVIVCFAVNSPTSYNNVQLKWMPEVRHYCPHAPVVLVATKTDLLHGRDAPTSLTTDDGDELARQLRADAYAECSSMTGDGVANVFQTAAREALRVGRQLRGKRQRRCDLF